MMYQMMYQMYLENLLKYIDHLFKRFQASSWELRVTDKSGNVWAFSSKDPCNVVQKHTTDFVNIRIVEKTNENALSLNDAESAGGMSVDGDVAPSEH